MNFEASVTYPNGREREVTNLGYMLRNWKEIAIGKFLAERHPTIAIVCDNPEIEVSIKVSKFEGERDHADAYVEVFFRDGRVYHTGFADKSILWRFLHRPIYYGLTVDWFGDIREIKREDGWKYE